MAERALSALTAQTPRVDVLFTRAVADEARRDLAAAERWYRELAAERPDDPTWMMELASFFDRQASNADAVAAYHDALKKDARLLRPRLELCRLYSQSRLNEPAEAKMHGQAALNGYRAIGARGGEAQSRLCLVDTLAFGTEVERTDAWSHAQAARKIFEDLQYDYNLTRGGALPGAHSRATRAARRIHRDRRDRTGPGTRSGEHRRPGDDPEQSRCCLFVAWKCAEGGRVLSGGLQTLSVLARRIARGSNSGKSRSNAHRVREAGRGHSRHRECPSGA